MVKKKAKKKSAKRKGDRSPSNKSKQSKVKKLIKFLSKRPKTKKKRR